MDDELKVDVVYDDLNVVELRHELAKLRIAYINAMNTVVTQERMLCMAKYALNHCSQALSSLKRIESGEL